MPSPLSARVSLAMGQFGAVTGCRLDPPEYRLRVGDYRVRFHQEGETILILRVRNRREAYR
ncbi:MAG: type II toxin-antitoxin system RelE/ParE family toxin [Bryobacteraceae bacterium]